MILKDNICTQTGDTLYFETTPIWGMMRQFTGFNEEIIGADPDNPQFRYFERQFRYSFDGGIVYSDWVDLTHEELMMLFRNWLATNKGYLSAPLDEQSDLKLQFKYERKGTNNTGTLQLNSLTLNGRIVNREFDFKTINNSIFAEIINNNIDLFNLTMNLTNKLYETGIVPDYIERKSEDVNSLLEDRDFIDLWKTVCEFYVMLFLYAMRFTNIYWQKDLLCEYLIQKGIYLCDCRDIIDMQLIAQNFYSEIRSRGTSEIFKPKGFKYATGRRARYKSPFENIRISDKNPIIIDGIKYGNFKYLPYGWTIQRLGLNEDDYEVLISIDMNYHKIQFCYTNELGEMIIADGHRFDDIESMTDVESDVVKPYNGEYLRLICYSPKCDEFIYNQVNSKDFGWNVNNASPMYKGLDDQYGTIVKAYEKFKDFVYLPAYPWFGGYLPTIVTETLQPEYCIPIVKNKAYSTDVLCVGIVLTSAEITL